MNSLYFKKLGFNTLDRRMMSLLNYMLSNQDSIFQDAQGGEVYVVFNEVVESFSDIKKLDRFSDNPFSIDLDFSFNHSFIVDDRIVGFFSVVPNGCLGLHKIYVSKDHQGKGFGFEIMDYIFDLISNDNYKELILKKEGSLGFWRKVKIRYESDYQIEDDDFKMSFRVKK